MSEDVDIVEKLKSGTVDEWLHGSWHPIRDETEAIMNEAANEILRLRQLLNGK